MSFEERGDRAPDDTAAGAVRRAGVLLSQRGVDFLSIGVLGATLPRLLGPEAFGQFNVIGSVVRFLAFVSGFGSLQVMSRFVPALMEKGDTAGIGRLFSGLLALRAATSLAAGAACFFALRLWLTDLSAVVVAMAAVAVTARCLANLPFALFLGLDRADRFGRGELLRNLLNLIIALPACFLLDLKGAVLAMLATETILLGLGLFWTREYLTRVSSSLLKEITPYARHHRIFFATNLLLAASQQGTAPLIRGIGGSFGDVAFFAAGHTLFLMSSAVLWQISQSLGPHFSKLKARQETAQIIVVAEAFLRLVAVASATLTLVALLVPHEIVGFVLGRSFAPAGATLAPLALAVTAATFCHLMRVLALAWDRIEVTFEAVAAQCVTLLILVPPLVRADGARGAAIAILGAQSVAALVWWRRMRTEAPGVLAGARRVLLIASPIFLVAAAGRSADLWLRVGLLVLCLAACGVALIRARVLDADEIRAWRAAGRLP